eukprot:TRINITY_DN2180_c0_g3_i1.p1 TRINITY_DN2180_c0_g3~~TRINITY_DN2180_c0_g3_i1.p1  ORF type:complete len:450 (+),score=70.40 TRINITY_DN2180_c0_g3_i1:108-1457(+)
MRVAAAASQAASLSRSQSNTTPVARTAHKAASRPPGAVDTDGEDTEGTGRPLHESRPSWTQEQVEDDSEQFRESLRRSARSCEDSRSLTLDAAKRVIYLYTRIHFVGDVNLATQQFSTRFDVHVLWRPQHAKLDEFSPIIRFPESVSWREVMRIDLTDDYDGQLVGFRRTIEGVFRTPLNLHSFPFDAQVLQIEMALGRCEKTGTKLSITNGWRFDHHPSEPNIILEQFDNTYAFRPLRYYLHQSGFLEDVDKSSKYTLVVPVVRDSRYFIQNQYLFVFLVFVMCDTLPYCLAMNDIVGKLTVVLTLYLLLVAYKFAIQAELPKLPYNTMFDSYIMFVFINISFTLIGLGFISAYSPLDGEEEGDTTRRDWTHYLSRGMGVLALVMHIYFVVAAWLGKRSQLDIVKSTGQIDQPLVDLLASAGVDVVDGVVKNIARYEQLLSADHAPEK